MSDISKIKVSGVEYGIKDIQAREDLGNLGTRVTELEQHGGGGASVELDTTLTQSGKAADAKAVGDALAGKVDKVTGKGLSTNDYTDAAKAKVDALAPVATSGNYNDLTNKPTIPTVLPNPHKLTINGTEYDGSADVQMTIEGGGGSVPTAGGVTTLHINVTAVNMETMEATFTADKTPAEMDLASANGPTWCVVTFAAGIMEEEAFSVGVPPAWYGSLSAFGGSTNLVHNENGNNKFSYVVREVTADRWILDITQFGG